MTPPDLIAVFLARLNATDIPYMVTGSVAATVYGEPRLTQDVDLVLRLDHESARRLGEAFPGAEYYVPPLETVTEEAGRSTGGHFNLLHLETGLRADCYLAGDDPLSQWGLATRRGVEVGPDRIWLAAPEYVILSKLDYFRAGGGEKHLTDIAQVLRVTGEGVDHSVIAAWVERLDLGREWQAARDRHAAQLRPLA
jgi:hypothetical protein